MKPETENETETEIVSLGEVREFIEKILVLLTENTDEEMLSIFKKETKNLAKALLREIPVEPKQMVLLSNGYPLPKKSLEIFLEIKTTFKTYV